MAELLHITTPVNSKGFEYANSKHAQQVQTDQVFNLGDTSKVQKTTERTEEYTNRDTKDGSALSINVDVPKNPSPASAILRSIVGSGTTYALSSEGSTDTLNKVTEFANEVMLNPSNLSVDMAAQEKDATIFGDSIWSEMKNILMSGSDEIGQAVLQFTKAASDASARDDILNSISSNLRFLAQNAAPSRELADQLTNAADSLNGENFASMKSSVLGMLDSLNNSLLINDDMKSLISLTIYNMSRYNGSASALGESFNAILDMTSGAKQADMLRQLFMKYIENADLPADIKIESLNSLVQGSAPAASSLSLLAEKLGETMNGCDISAASLAAALDGIDPEGGTEALRDTLLAAMPNSTYGGLNSIIKSYDATGNIRSLLDRLSIMINSVDDMEKKTLLADKVNDILSHFTVNEKDISLTTDSILQQQSLTLLSQRLGSNLDSALESISAQQLSAMLSGLNTINGSASLRAAFEMLLPQNSTGELNLLLRSFNSTGDLNKLIDCLSITLNSIKDMDKKIILAQSVNEMLENLTNTQGVKYQPPTSMANLMDFLAKNLNDPSLKSLSSMSRSDIMQGLLTAPGVFTPLLHYLVPIDDGEMKAFGELWADPDAENRNGAKESKHLFLCFDIEDVGYFELELQTQDKNLQVTLLCPAGTESIFRPVKDDIGRLAAANGYTAEGTRIGALIKKRDLTQVFPKIQEKRSGLNVKI